MKDWINKTHTGDVRAVLREMIADGVKVQTIITSPPYWGLRSYLPKDHPNKALEIGSEPTLGLFLETMVGVFNLAREVLADDGTLWCNMGDSYAQGHGGSSTEDAGVNLNKAARASHEMAAREGIDVGGWTTRDASLRNVVPGTKPKDLMGQPWRLAFALQDAGWYLRQDIVWAKPNPMPESIRDRCTKAHEYIFLLSKQPRYYYDFEAMQEPVSGTANARRAKSTGVGFGYATDAQERERGRVMPDPNVGRRVHAPGNVNPPKGQQAYEDGDESHRTKGGLLAYAQRASFDEAMAVMPNTRNKRSVWTVPSQPYSEAHFATFPPKLIEPCVLAGCPVGGIVLDIFMGSGTTAQVAQQLGRNYIGIDIDDKNERLQADRTRQPSLMFGGSD